jgi:hypothetical protein
MTQIEEANEHNKAIANRDKIRKFYQRKWEREHPEADKGVAETGQPDPAPDSQRQAPRAEAQSPMFGGW